MGRLKRHLFEIVLLAPAFLYLVGALIVVVIYLTKLSFTVIDTHYLEVFPALGNWEKVLSSFEFSKALWNTVVFVLIGTPLELAAGLFLALLIHRSFRGRNIVQSLFTLPLAIPALVTAIMLVILFDFPGGHINNILTGRHFFFPAVLDYPINFRSSAFFALGVSMIGKVWRDMPISMIILLIGLHNIEEEQNEAAISLGATLWQKFWWVTVPLLLPYISGVLILRSIEFWKEFIFPFVLAGRYPLLGTLIESLYHSWQKPGEAAVVAIVLLGCVLASTIFLFITLRIIRKIVVRVI